MDNENDISRKDFFSGVVALGAGLFVRSSNRPLVRSLHRPFVPSSPLVILFQGDSVTDNSRERNITTANDTRELGSGYPLFVAAAEMRAHPHRDLRFYNRGVSGNKLPDLEARWQADTLDLKPDVLSVLIGVNDFWHTMSVGYKGTLADYEARYSALLQRTRDALPDVRFVVMEPFAHRGRFVDDRWYPAFAEYQAAAKRVAKRMDATFVPLQAAFDKAAKETDAGHWTRDGIHPTAPGQALIAEQWRSRVHI